MKKTPVVLDKENEMRMERLRTALAEGEASGAPAPSDMDEFIAEKKRAR